MNLSLRYKSTVVQNACEGGKSLIKRDLDHFKHYVVIRVLLAVIDLWWYDTWLFFYKDM